MGAALETGRRASESALIQAQARRGNASRRAKSNAFARLNFASNELAVFYFVPFVLLPAHLLVSNFWKAEESQISAEFAVNESSCEFLNALVNHLDINRSSAAQTCLHPSNSSALIVGILKILSEHRFILKNITRFGIDDREAEAGFPFISVSVFSLGGFFMARFMVAEYRTCSKTLRNIKETVSVGELLQSRLDFHFSSSPWAKPMLLLTVTFFLIMAATIAFVTLLGQDLSSASWRAWTFVADPGAQADTIGTVGRIIAFLTTVGGMLLFALMIGVVSDSIGKYLDDFKKGKSKLIESGHTLILNWSEKVMPILQQLALANASEGGKSIVVLTEEDKEELDQRLRSAVSSKEGGLRLHGTRVTFRSGNPLAMNDLVKVSAGTARSIIVLSPDGLQPDIGDSRMVRQVLALQEINSKGGGLSGHLVVEVQDVDNKASVQMVGKGDIEVIVSHDLIGRMMLLAARSPWLSTVLDQLMGFEGSELYLKEWPELVNEKYGSLMYYFEDAVPMGVKRAVDQAILVNPGEDLVIAPGDMILVLAEDDDAYCVNKKGYNVNMQHLNSAQFCDRELPKTPEKVLFCGWRRDMADMINELDCDVPAESELWLFNSVPMVHRATMLLDSGNKLALKLKNLRIKHVVGNTSVRRQLLSLPEVSDGTDGLALGERTGRRVALDYFTSILILSDGSEVDAEVSDSRTMSTALMMHEIQHSISSRMMVLGEQRDFPPPVSEILNSRTRSLMQLNEDHIHHDQVHQGYVLSNQLVAAAVAMVSEDRDMNKIYGELWSCQGNQIQVRNITDFISIDDCGRDGNESYSFWDIAWLARRHKEVAIGYISLHSDGPADQVHLNPTCKAEPRRWDPNDKVIVIGLCRQATLKAQLAASRWRFEAELDKILTLRGNISERDARPLRHSGWLRRLLPGREKAMQDESSWKERLYFVIGSELLHASESTLGETRLDCGLAGLTQIHSVHGWPPGYQTFTLEVQRAPPIVLSAYTPEECEQWIKALQAAGAAAVGGH